MNQPKKPKPDLRIGDLLAGILKKAGIKPCSGCKKRQDALNKIKFPRP